MYLHLSIEGASTAELRRGLDAAKAVFEKANMHPQTAAEGRFALEGWDIGGFEGELSTEDSKAADVWMEADHAAIEACCADWPADRARPYEALQLLSSLDQAR
ncbi:hypothetical protein [Pseudaminobacter sp. NGMCC 1.201702]|uniref:hypothetical protein n=1 Tax=Pseudaminobacter sp. NGMCC 1.201702 TaxID=3391825 RepID=UPI0039EF9D19